MEDNKLVIITKPEQPLSLQQEINRMMERNLEISRRTTTEVMLDEKEAVHRLEFVMYKAYTVCNVMINGTWHTCSFPASTTVGEFLIHGSIHSAKNWPRGRRYDNGDI